MYNAWEVYLFDIDKGYIAKYRGESFAMVLLTLWRLRKVSPSCVKVEWRK